MNNQHTKEPWSVSSRDIATGMSVNIVSESGATIAIMKAAHNNKIANASRIVACVNACIGIDTKFLDGDDNLPNFSRRMMQQRDDLLAACRRASLALAFAAETSPEMMDDYNALSSAISKATKGD